MPAMSDSDKAEIARQTAKKLLALNAVRFQPDPPFILTSGLASPVYVDCRKIISYPTARREITNNAVRILKENIGLNHFNAVAGGETGGIPFAAWIADQLDLAMYYVRKKPKGFGRNAHIEGCIEAAKNVVLIEDLATDGRSKTMFAQAMRQADLVVQHSLVIFYYGIFPQTLEKLSSEGITLHALTTWKDVFRLCRREGLFDSATLNEVEKFLLSPFEWSVQHGGSGDIGPANDLQTTTITHDHQA